MGARDQQGVLAVEVVGEPAAVGLLGRLVGGAAAQPPVLLVLGQHGDVADAQPQRRLPLPPVGEPLRLGELHPALAAGQQHHRPAALDRGELLVVPGHHHLAAALTGQREDRRGVGQRHHARLIQDQQRSRRDRQRAARLPAAFQVAKEPGGVVGAGHPRVGEHVRRGLGGGEPDHLPHPGFAPHPGHLRDGAGLAGTGGPGHDLRAPRRGQHPERGSGLIQAQPRAGCLTDRARVGALRLELRLQPRLIRAEQPRRHRRFQARGASLLGVGEQPVLHRELRAGGVTARTVRDVHALTRGAAQAIGHARPLRRGQQDRLGGQRPARQIRQQPGGVRGAHRAQVRGQALTEVTDQVGFGPGRLRRLHCGHSFLHNGQLIHLGQRRDWAPVRGRAGFRARSVALGRLGA